MNKSSKFSGELLSLCDYVLGGYPRGVGPSLVERVPGYVETRRLAESGALDALLEALRPFAHYACDEECRKGDLICANCTAAAAIRAIEPGWKP